MFGEILEQPSRYHRHPLDVIRDRRFSVAEKLAILEAWERKARAAGADPDALGRIAKVRAEIEGMKGDHDA